jgi:hypothetical protein
VAWFVISTKVITPTLNAGSIDYAGLYSHLGETPGGDIAARGDGTRAFSAGAGHLDQPRQPSARAVAALSLPAASSASLAANQLTGVAAAFSLLA